MNTLLDSVITALHLIWDLDSTLWSVVVRSVAVSATACLLAYVLGVALGAWLAVARFAGRGVGHLHAGIEREMRGYGG